MKKIVLTCLALVLSVFAKANTDLTGYDYAVYFGDATGQIGGTAIIPIYAKIATPKDGFQPWMVLPEGVTYKSESLTCASSNYACMINEATVECSIYDATGKNPYPAGDNLIGYITVDIDPSMKPGKYDISIKHAYIADVEVMDNIVSTLTVQRAAPIVAQPSDFIFDVTPVTLATGTQALAIKMKNTYDVANFKIVATYPEGIAPKTGRGVSVTTVTDKLYSSTDNSVTPLSVTQAVSGQVATYTVNNSALDTYVASDNYHNICIVPVNVTANNSVLNVKFEVSDVKAYDVDSDPNFASPLDVASGSFMTSIFVGTPTESDPIVYGNYESEGARSALQTITGARTVDMTQTTGMTAESAATSLEGVYVQGATQSALMPKSKGTYRTVCVPFAVSGTGRYIISSVGESSITLSSAPETIPANTPFVATAGVVVGDESVYPNPDITHETSAGALLFKGVYKKTTINTGTYYIAKDKFWKAESEVTVAPFKAILVGSLAAKSLKIFIEDETGIREVTNQFDNEDIYNLQGIKLNKTQKGINIVGGKKVILK